MAKKYYRLARTVRHNGERFSPGDEKKLLGILDAEQLQSFISRKHIEEVVPEGVSLSGDEGEAELQILREQIESLTARNTVLEAELAALRGSQKGDGDELRPHLKTLLDKSGFDTPEKVRAATDEALIEIDGIGKESLKEIRAAYGEYSPAE